ncbi:hypothetical protein [uncultured Thiohalocapsa sp.]|uniref:hypothetical protein n=1 Tax=uncultured Thiohalocapsa sp. TaxID=768990 RepID=UPI0025E90AEC|nr:hypothetical protein [uncultured Thiohalocapsa sp.]
MNEDPILAEVHRLREEYAASLNHDAAAIYQDILRRQRETTRKLVRFAPRPSSVTAKPAKSESEPATTA